MSPSQRPEPRSPDAGLPSEDSRRDHRMSAPDDLAAVGLGRTPGQGWLHPPQSPSALGLQLSSHRSWQRWAAVADRDEVTLTLRASLPAAAIEPGGVQGHGRRRRPDTSVTDADVVVAGAGLAGLACAFEVATAGREVLVLAGLVLDELVCWEDKV